MNLNITSGLHLALFKTSSSKLAKKILAKYLDALDMSTMKVTQLIQQPHYTWNNNGTWPPQKMGWNSKTASTLLCRSYVLHEIGIILGVTYIFIWVRSRNCGCLVTWFCYQLIAKPGNKIAAVPWPDPSVNTTGRAMKYMYTTISNCCAIYTRVIYCAQSVHSKQFNIYASKQFHPTDWIIWLWSPDYISWFLYLSVVW